MHSRHHHRVNNGPNNDIVTVLFSLNTTGAAFLLLT